LTIINFTSLSFTVVSLQQAIESPVWHWNIAQS
jgi:hypothetical protein